MDLALNKPPQKLPVLQPSVRVSRREDGRHRAVRAETISLKRMTKRVMAVQRALTPEGVDHWRPRTRGECENVERPCPYVGCRYNLYLDVDPRSGSIKLNFPDLEPDELVESCALDLADQFSLRLE